MAAVSHVQRLWGRWWWLPLLPAVYAIVVLSIGDARPEHWVMAAVCVVLAFSTQATKRFLVDIAPYILVGLGYDMVRYARVAFVTADRVWGCGLRDAELAVFSVREGVTLQDYFAVHHLMVADFIFAVPYAIFAYLALAYAAYLYFKDRPRMRHFLWSFAVANFISFFMWLVVPAAPPWYIHEHGCTIDMSAQPSPAALARVDAYLDIDYFETFYSRAASVFGAMPSMHCAYPLLGLLTARRAATWRTWPLHIGYTILMAVAAVYLNHHWVWDVIAGWVVAAVSVAVAGWMLRVSRFSENEPGPEPVAPPFREASLTTKEEAK